MEDIVLFIGDYRRVFDWYNVPICSSWVVISAYNCCFGNAAIRIGRNGIGYSTSRIMCWGHFFLVDLCAMESHNDHELVSSEGCVWTNCFSNLLNLRALFNSGVNQADSGSVFSQFQVVSRVINVFGRLFWSRDQGFY